MRRKTLRTVKNSIAVFYLAVSAAAGILFYSVFMGFRPGLGLSDLLIIKTGMKPFIFFGLCAVVFIVFPVILAALAVYGRFYGTYIVPDNGSGNVRFSDKAVEAFVADTAVNQKGIAGAEASVDIYRDRSLGIRLWIGTDAGGGFESFSERLRRKIIKDIETNFGTGRIRYFHIAVETTDINASRSKGK